MKVFFTKWSVLQSTQTGLMTFIGSYLAYNSFFVRFDGMFSGRRRIHAEVPQKSLFGQIKTVSTNHGCVCVPPQGVLPLSVSNSDQICGWASKLRLILNADMCVAMRFSRKHSRNPLSTQITIGGNRWPDCGKVSSGTIRPL